MQSETTTKKRSTLTPEREEIDAADLGPSNVAVGSEMVATWKHKRETYTFDGSRWVLVLTELL